MEKQITQIEEFVIKWLESQEEKKCFEPDKDGYIMFRRGGLSINLPVYLMMVLEDYLEEQALSKAEGKCNNGWISVEDRLPDIESNVLFYSPTEYDGEPFKGYRHRRLDRYFTLAGNQVFGITHWQPLPPKP